MTPIAHAHSRIRALLAAQLQVLPDQHEVNDAINVEIDHLLAHAGRAPAENANDVVLQIDLAVAPLEGLHGNLTGVDRAAVETAMATMASAATMLALVSETPLRDEGTVSGLASFAIRAGTQYCQPAA